MKQTEKEVYLPNVDSLFTSQKSREEFHLGLMTELPICDIDDFPNHPFRVDISEEDEILQSIKEIGITTPILVRPKENGKYELISGNRRKKACELLGKNTIPCVIRELSNEEATILMVDSNYQREKILPSEKAFAYKMKYDAMRHQGKRNDLTFGQNDQKSTAEKKAEELNESEKSIRRYIRLTKLIPELLTMVDNDALKLSPSMAISPAYEVSFLTQDEQKSLLDFMQCYDCTPSHAQAIELKNHSQKGTLTVDYMEELLSEEKPNQIPKIGVSMERLVFPDNIKSDKEREDFIVKAVRFYVNYQRKKQKQNQSR